MILKGNSRQDISLFYKTWLFLATQTDNQLIKNQNKFEDFVPLEKYFFY